MKKKIFSLISLMILGTGISFNTLTNDVGTSQMSKNRIDAIGQKENKSATKEKDKKDELEKGDSKNTSEEIEREDKESENQSENDSSIESEKNVTNQNQINTNTPNSSQNNNGVVQNTPPPEPVTPPQASPQTAWEKLGISEYEYYHTPLFANDYVDFDSTAKCSAFIQAVKNYCQLDGGYQEVAGKYTGGSIGCRVRIYINGNTNSYNQLKSTDCYSKIPENIR